MNQDKCVDCPTCQSGKVIYCHSMKVINLEPDVAISHMDDCTLEEYHSEEIPYLFLTMAGSSIESLKKWVQTFGIPSVNPWIDLAKRWNIPKENFIYLLDNGLDPNIFFKSDKLILLYIPEMKSIDLIKLLLQSNYIFPPYHKQKNSLLDMSNWFSVEEFTEVTELWNFSEADAKCYISTKLHSDTLYTHDFQFIRILSNKFNLKEFILSCSAIQCVNNFIETLD